MIEEYIKMRNSQRYNIEWFYKYFQSKGGNLDSNVFNIFFQKTYDLTTVLEYLDGEFKLTSLHAPLEPGEKVLGKFIKIAQ